MTGPVRYSRNVTVDVQRIRWQLAIRGWTCKEFAAKSGVHWVTISRAMNGHIALRPKTLRKLAKALYDNPPAPGADLLLGEVAAAFPPINENAAAGASPGGAVEVSRGSGNP